MKLPLAVGSAVTAPLSTMLNAQKCEKFSNLVSVKYTP
jgi:hypothetical protein